VSPFEQYDIMHGSPDDEAPEYETTDDDLILAFECATDLQAAFAENIEDRHPNAYLNDDADSLASLSNWMDAISQLPYKSKIAVIETMQNLLECNKAIQVELDAITLAAYVNDDDE
jgi:hypothetical protein